MALVYKVTEWLCVIFPCGSGDPEPRAGVSVVGLHQPPAEEGRRGDRTRDKDQQSRTAAG